jgi:hypothetical protein
VHERAKAIALAKRPVDNACFKDPPQFSTGGNKAKLEKSKSKEASVVQYNSFNDSLLGPVHGVDTPLMCEDNAFDDTMAVDKRGYRGNRPPPRLQLGPAKIILPVPPPATGEEDKSFNEIVEGYVAPFPIRRTPPDRPTVYADGTPSTYLPSYGQISYSPLSSDAVPEFENQLSNDMPSGPSSVTPLHDSQGPVPIPVHTVPPNRAISASLPNVASGPTAEPRGNNTWPGNFGTVFRDLSLANTLPTGTVGRTPQDYGFNASCYWDESFRAAWPPVRNTAVESRPPLSAAVPDELQLNTSNFDNVARKFLSSTRIDELEQTFNVAAEPIEDSVFMVKSFSFIPEWETYCVPNKILEKCNEYKESADAVSEDVESMTNRGLHAVNTLVEAEQIACEMANTVNDFLGEGSLLQQLFDNVSTFEAACDELIEELGQNPLVASDDQTNDNVSNFRGNNIDNAAEEIAAAQALPMQTQNDPPPPPLPKRATRKNKGSDPLMELGPDKKPRVQKK